MNPPPSIAASTSQAAPDKGPSLALANFGGVLLPTPLSIPADPTASIQPLWPSLEIPQSAITPASKSSVGSAPIHRVFGQKALVLGRYGEPALLRGIPLPILTPAQHDIVTALHQECPRRLNKRELDKRSGHKDARKILQRLVNGQSAWAGIIIMGKDRKGYGLNLD